MCLTLTESVMSDEDIDLGTLRVGKLYPWMEVSLIMTEGTFHVFWERVMNTPDSQPRNTTRFLCVCISNILLPRQGLRDTSAHERL